MLEIFKHVRFEPSHDLQVLRGEFKRGGFEVEVPRRLVENEAEIDVDDVAIFGNQNVAVVAILDVQEILQEGVPGQGLGEILLGLSEVLKLRFENVQQRGVFGKLLFEGIDGLGLAQKF